MRFVYVHKFEPTTRGYLRTLVSVAQVISCGETPGGILLTLASGEKFCVSESLDEVAKMLTSDSK